MIPAVGLRLELDKPVTKIAPEEMEIPEPAVNPSWIPRLVILALVIFNLVKSIAAEASTSAFTMADLVDNDPKPKFVLAPAAVVAPVPPLARLIVVPLQVPPFKFPVKLISPVN